MILSTLLLLAAASATAPTPDCMDNAQTNLDFQRCGAAEVQQADAELNRVWKRVYGGLDAQTKAALLTEQRLWIRFKDKSCAAWQTGYFGREGQTLHFYNCRALVINQRTEYLKSLGNSGM